MSVIQSQNRILHILKYLWQKTDEEHPASIADIIGYLNENGIEAHRHTVTAAIEQLTEFGIDIVCVRSTQNRYFIADRVLELPELKLLVDAVDAARFISVKRSKEISRKLTALASEYQAEELHRNIFTDKRVKADNTALLIIIDQLNQAINQARVVEFQYFEYDPDKNKVLRHNGEVYSLSPHYITWGNDNYYVIGHSEKHGKEVSYRVDRITRLTVTDREALPPSSGFDIANFCRTAFLMFGSEEKRVELLCHNDMMKTVIDKFGEDVETSRQDSEHFIAKVDVAVSPTFFSWVFNYQGRIRILSPVEVKQEFRKMLDTFQ